jgi:hypothetical protein
MDFKKPVATDQAALSPTPQPSSEVANQDANASVANQKEVGTQVGNKGKEEIVTTIPQMPQARRRSDPPEGTVAFDFNDEGHINQVMMTQYQLLTKSQKQGLVQYVFTMTGGGYPKYIAVIE